MAIILNIDTATETGSVCLASGGRVLGARSSHQQRDHAAVIAVYIAELLKECGIRLGQLDAVAISGGPGSYTGLRVAAATAKGLCYGLGIPLIATGTLEMMAAARRAEGAGRPETLYCPVIEARRMDVFGALYDGALRPLAGPGLMTLDENFLSDYRDRPVEVFGTGMDKSEQVLGDFVPWRFIRFQCHASQLIPFSEQAFREKHFEDLAYFDPFYLKAFYRPETQA